jgi:hypothetical protein
MGGATLHDNYVQSITLTTNGEYGPNGQTPGAAWVGGCEIDGARGFEAKEAVNMSIYNNTFVVQGAGCGGGALVFTAEMLPCTDATCPTTTTPFDVHDNVEIVQNTSGGSTLSSGQPLSCYILDGSSGSTGNWFTPFLRDRCTTDGNFITSDGYDPGNDFSWVSPTFALGTHPLADDCGGSSSTGSTCGRLVMWFGQEAPPSDELGYSFQDLTLSSGASLSFNQAGTAMARGATIEWTYQVTVQRASNGGPASGALVSATDAGGNHASCTTDGTGTCSMVLRQEVVGDAQGAPISTTSENPNSVTITEPGCNTLNYDLTIVGTTNETKVLSSC